MEEKTTQTIEVRIDRDRMLTMVTVDEMLDLQDGSMKAIADVLAKFVYRDGHYLPFEQARPLIGKLTMGQLTDLAKTFASTAEDTVVPLVNSGA